MIVVIADDLTGAGEIGGIGLAYGLSVELQRDFFPGSDAELLVIDTDTRSCSPDEAKRVMRDVAQCLNASQRSIEWIYKKTDSVLRGPVASELEALLDVMKVERALLVPANPSKGRTLSNGNYRINGTLLSETDFADDPEYPARTSNVLELPAFSGSYQIYLLKYGQPFLYKGIVIGQAETSEDLTQWSKRMDEQTMMAGAGEFFEAILKRKGFSKRQNADKSDGRLGNKALFVCGSSSKSSRQALQTAESLGGKVCRMPEALFRSDAPEEALFQQWSDAVISGFEQWNTVIVAIDHDVVKNTEFAGKLRRRMARIVSSVLEKMPVKELFVEGGATASEVVDCLGWNRFEPCDSLADGVVRMKVWGREQTYLTIKPGSYPWPHHLWKKELFERQSIEDL